MLLYHATRLNIESLQIYVGVRDILGDPGEDGYEMNVTDWSKTRSLLH